ncbi:MAG: outer membrane beta-barrel protein [Acidobacteria bacterium]|nr:outer membrane beta-barrel protein [Acidobacteriota bacterium]
MPTASVARAFALSACLVLGSAGAAQELSLGVIGGLYLNDDFRSRPDQFFESTEPLRSVSISRESSSFTPRIGPKVQVDFGQRWALEADVLFHRPVWTYTARYDPPIESRPGGPLVSEFVDRFDELMIEIPILAKRRFRLGGANLILEGGPALLPFGGYDNPGKVGIVGGVGTVFGAGPLRLQPTVRYTRWSASPEEASGGSPYPFRRDRISVLLGVDLPAASLGAKEPPSEAFSVGFIGGTTLTAGFPEKNGFAGLTTRMAGVAVEYRVSPRWSVEADALYHPLILSERARATVLTWETPVLAKRRFELGPTRPIAFAGPTFRLSGNRNSSRPSTVGVVAGAGVELRRGRFFVTPSLRYVRWAQDAPADNAPGMTRRNQVQALVTIGFGGR